MKVLIYVDTSKQVGDPDHLKGRSISSCRDRNLLAHGLWWEFNVDTITVRSWVEWPKQDQHRTFTVAEIQDTATSFDDLEVKLWKRQRAIEARTRKINCPA